MKVLKKRKKPVVEVEEWSQEVTCTGKGNEDEGCGSKLLIKESDLFITSGSYCGVRESFVTFRCPCCGELTDLGDYRGGGRPLSDQF